MAKNQIPLFTKTSIATGRRTRYTYLMDHPDYSAINPPITTTNLRDAYDEMKKAYYCNIPEHELPTLNQFTEGMRDDNRFGPVIRK